MRWHGTKRYLGGLPESTTPFGRAAPDIDGQQAGNFDWFGFLNKSRNRLKHNRYLIIDYGGRGCDLSPPHRLKLSFENSSRLTRTNSKLDLILSVERKGKPSVVFCADT